MEARLAEGVKHEFDEAVLWYQEADPGLVKAFRAETLRILAEIGSHPLRWPKVSPRVRRCLYHRRFPYAMLYQVRKDHVLVMSIMHTSRRPGYWKTRVAKK